MKLQAKNICKSFGKTEVLKNLSLELEEGTMTAIVGENGSGKSTFLKILVGEWAPSSGQVSILGNLGYCPQHITLFPNLTVQNHFDYFAAAYSLELEAKLERQSYLMNYFDYSKYSGYKVAQLSGGTAQKLNLSLALLHNPEILILDEPYSGFDWDTYLKFWSYTKEVLEQNCTILIVSHLISDKDRFDKIYKLDNGSLI